MVEAGEAVGVQLDASSRPAVGSHEHATPPVPSSCTESPEQSVAPPLATAVGRALTVSVASSESSAWPKPSVTTTS